jgi:hypothetical protein
LIPTLIAEGLAANDHIKVRLSVMPAANHALDGALFNLGDECRAAGIDPVPMETLVNQASLLPGDQISAPGLGKLSLAAWDNMATMIRAVDAADKAMGAAALARLAEIKGVAASEPTDAIALLQPWIFKWRQPAPPGYSSPQSTEPSLSVPFRRSSGRGSCP